MLIMFNLKRMPFMIKNLKKPVMYTMMAAFLAGGIHAPASADMVDNKQLAMQSELQMQRDSVMSLMAREDVQSTMMAYGISASDIENRINNLTEAELLQIQGQLDQLPAGEGVLGAVLTILLIFILLDLAGVTDIFPGV
jgi:predicted Zn-dependent peptidase|tara:strand:+ start:287 stop:703 length:417 start_codon:yes stop_codon:yes gene_type:complete